MTTTDPVWAGVAELSQAFGARRLSPVDVVDALLARIRQHDPALHAFIAVYADEARLAAEGADRAIRAGQRVGPLHGVPIALKDAIDMKGLPTTAGYAGWASSVGGIDVIPATDAPVTARLEAAGAIIIGKSNLPAFAADGTRASTSFDGPTYNAYGLTIAPGASSSGSATAAAASFAAAGIAEETGGSIQNPAATRAPSTARLNGFRSARRRDRNRGGLDGRVASIAWMI